MQKIAVIGMSCLFPGATTPEQFMRNLLENKDSTSAPTAADMGADPALYYSPRKGKTDRFYSVKGGYVRDFAFDPSGFDIPQKALVVLDDVYRWSLYTAQQALRDAGCLHRRDALRRCGVILGNLSFPTKTSNQLYLPLYHQVIERIARDLTGLTSLKFPTDPATDPLDFRNSRISGYPSALLAKALSLKGGHFTIDAACASSVYAVKLACDQLRSEKVDLMLAGAVSAGDPFFINMGFSTFTAFPENGESRPLDRRSGGLVSGEGAGMLVLKRLEDALRNEDRIYAVIDGIGLSNDGRGKSVLSPNAQGQILAYERAYSESGVQPDSVGYIECHATGTPVGDAEEIASLAQYFGRYQARPLLGSVKANFGHLLTAAGMPSMIKVILSMIDGRIPATIHVQDPVFSENHDISSDQVVSRNTEWPQGKSRYHGAVNAFGFGGSNAHIVFTHPHTLLKTPKRKTREKKLHIRPEPPPAMAIVGMDVHFGSCDTLNAFDHMVYSKQSLFRPLPEKRWKGMDKDPELMRRFGLKENEIPNGAFIEDFQFDTLRFRIPPTEVAAMIPQQLLMMHVADRAIRDAQIKEGANVAVLVAMETDSSLHQFRGRIDIDWKTEKALAECNAATTPAEATDLKALLKDAVRPPVQVNEFTSFIGNIMACRIASLWDFSGPALTVSAEENAVFKALETAQWLLANSEVEAVVVGAVDMAGNVEDVLLRNRFMDAVNRGKPSSDFEADASGWLIGEGAGAVVLKLRESARKEKDRTYAIIDAVSNGSAADADEIAAVCLESMRQAGVKASDIEYLEISGNHDRVEDRIAALASAYSDADKSNCALGSTAANVGHCFTALGMAGLIKTALALYRRYLPAVPNWNRPKQPSIWQSRPFYVETESKSWLPLSGMSKRHAAVFATACDHSVAHMVMSEDTLPKQRSSSLLQAAPVGFMPLVAEDRAAVSRELTTLRNEVSQSSDLKRLFRKRMDEWQQTVDAAYTVSIVGDSREKLLLEIDAALEGVETAFQQNREWISPSGSCFTPKPLGRAGTLAFVYPGAFNAYIGMGRDLFQVFPELYDLMATYTSRPELMLRDRLVFPRSLERLSDQEKRKRQADLDRDAIAVFETGINMAVLNTAVARGVLGLQPRQVFGYSMGEVSMNFAMGVWESTDKMSDILHTHPIFRERLAGPMNAAREAWGMPSEAADRSHDIWSCYTVSAPAGAVTAEIESEPHVYLIIINSPQEVVIAGETESCRRVVERLPYRAVQTPMTDTIHCEMVRPEFDNIVYLHHSPVSEISGIDFYSAADDQPVTLSADAVAENIARIYCQTIDFPRLVNRVYEDGARVFIEMGPRESCSRFISETLGERDHLSLSLDRKGSDVLSNLVRVISRLLSHQIQLDLSLFIRHLNELDEKPAGGRKTIVPGGNDMMAVAVDPEHRNRFRKSAATADRGGSADAAKRPRPAVSAAPPRETPHLLQGIQSSIAGHRSRISSTHAAFLEARLASLQEMRELIRLQMMVTGQAGGAAPPPLIAPVDQPDRRVKPPGVIWDEADLLEFAEGKIANVFGEAYAIIDTYPYRVRLPMPPYLLVHRVTALDARRGEFRPSSLTTEYDIPYNAWYSVDGQIPWAIASEAGQCDLLLISFIGIDFQSRGKRYYRLTDYTMTFFDDLPKEGDTLRYEIRIESFMKSGEALFFNFGYDCYVKDRLGYKMTGGRAGFSTAEELAQGKGIFFSKVEEEERRKTPKKQFTPLLTCEETFFDREALLNMTRGNIAACLGPSYDQQGANPSLRFSAEKIMMLDRIVSIDRGGGPWGLGEVIAEKDLAPDHWYFPCHFKDDNVLAGTLITEGCVQLLEFYMLYLGLQVCTRDARFQPIKNRPYVIRARGQIVPTDTQYSYRMEVIDIGVAPRPYARANFYILMNDRIIVDFRDLGIEMVEKTARIMPARKPAIFEKRHIDAFATGSLSDCFGPDYDIYENRRAPRTPNGDLQLMSRILTVEGKRLDFSQPSNLIAEYDVPVDAWFLRNSAGGAIPYSMMMEIALQPCGFLSTTMGATMLYTEADLCFRNLSSDATLHLDPDPGGKTITAYTELLDVSKAAETIVLNFNYALEIEGHRFYEGRTQFGYFTPHALSMQKGLDRGELIPPWSERNKIQKTAAEEIDLKSTEIRERFYESAPGKPYYRMNGPQLDFLDKAWVFTDSGKYGKGYILAAKAVDPGDWFYPCHFFQDPVMPGSLGVEAIIQAMRIFALHQDLGREMTSPRFTNAPGLTRWIYRGQITPDNETMDLEVHIKTVTRTPEQVVMTADANLWKNGMRIYEVTDAALALVET